MSMLSSFHPVVRRSLATVAVAGTGILGAQAQTTTPVAQPFSPQPVNFQVAVPALGSNLLSDSNTSFSSSSAYEPEQAAQTQLASVEKSFLLPGANAMQYGQRRRYGAPRYRGGNTNADGSEKYTGFAGAGFTIPTGGTDTYLSPSYGIQVGGGRNFNKHFGVNLEFDYDHFGLSGTAISNYLYANTGSTDNSSYDIGGNNHIWNFSIQPTYQIYSGQGLGAYITGGVGFYHKVTNFTIPETEESYYGYFTSNETFDHYTSNAPGFDGAVGFTYKFSRFANERLYGEVRYVYIKNQYKSGATTYDTTYTGNNFFPANSLTTSYIPVKFGIRF